MVAIYLTGITIAMLNITGIGFVIFMILFNPSNNQLKKSNLKKSSTISDSIKSDIQSFLIPSANGTTNHDKTRTLSATQSKRAPERVREKSGVPSGAAEAGIVIASAAGTTFIEAESSGSSNINRSNEFDNIDDILKDLNLKDFDDLNLDDFN